MEIIASDSCDSTIVWLHHPEFNEKLGEKARQKLHKDPADCFEWNLEAIRYKTPTVQPLSSHLRNHLS